MKQTTAPESTPSPSALQAQPHGRGDKKVSASSRFITMALDMSWRLALVVLIPIIGGYELDQRLDMTPLLTITGFLLAMGGMALVLWRMLQQAGQLPPPAKPEEHS